MTALRREPTIEASGPMMVPRETATEDSSSGLFRVLVLLWDRRRTLARIVLSLTLATAIITFLIPTRYQSRARLMPPEKNGTDMAMMAALLSKSGAGGGIANLATDLMGGKSTGALIVGVLRSQTVEDEVIRRFDLKRVYREWKDEDARAELESRTDISEDRKSGIVEIAVLDGNRERAAGIARAYVDQLDRLLASLNTSSAHREREFLEQRLAVVRLELDSAAKNLSEFSSKHGTVDLKEQGRAMVESAATLQGQLIAAEAERQGMAQFYTPENARMKSLDARIRELRSQMQKMGGTAGAAGNEQTEGGYPTLRGLPVLGVTYANLYRELKVREAVYETLTQQYELAKVAEVKEIPSIKVLDEPRPAQKKSWPPRLLIIALGCLFSLVIATAWLIGEARWNSLPRNDARKLFVAEISETAAGWVPRIRSKTEPERDEPTHLPADESR